MGTPARRRNHGDRPSGAEFRPGRWPESAGPSCGGPAAQECGWRALCRSGARALRVAGWLFTPRALWIHRVIHDPATFDEYESQRILESVTLYREIVSGVLGIVFAVAFVRWMSGARLVAGVYQNIIPLVFNKFALELVASSIPSSSSSKFWRNVIWTASHISAIVVPSFVRLVYASRDDATHQLMFFQISFVATMFLQSAVGYIPGRHYHSICCPVFAMVWIGANVSAGVELRVTVSSGVFIVVCCALVLGTVDGVKQRNFLLTHELEQARLSLEHVLSAQQSVFGTIFDAAAACDDEGQIVQSTPQMLELLGSSDLLHTSFASLAASAEERRRVQEFLRTVWSSGVGKATMIQARLRRGSDRDRDPQCGDTFEASIVCVRLPGASVAAQPAKLWAHDGLFLGMQEVGCGLFVPPASVAGSAPASAGGAADGDRARTSRSRSGGHEIIFDAGSPTLEVIDCSTAFSCAGLSGSIHGLLELVPAWSAGHFDNWVYDEVQGAAVSRACRSRVRLRQMTLDLSPSPGVRMQAQRSWLEFGGLEHYAADVPVRLVLSGLRACMRPPGSPLEPIQEGAVPQGEALPPQAGSSEGGGAEASGADGASGSGGSTSSIYSSASGHAAAHVDPLRP